MKRMIGLLLTFLALGLFMAGAIHGRRFIGSRQENAPHHQQLPPAVEFVTARAGIGTRSVPALAVLKSRATIRIMPETAGKLLQLEKREGDFVQAGEVIAQIQGDEVKAQWRSATAQSQSAVQQTNAAAESIRSLSSQKPALVANEAFWRAEQERDQALFRQGALAKAQWESTTNRYAEAQAKLAGLDAQIAAARSQMQAVASQKDAAAQTAALWKVRSGFAEVTAPVSGVISARLQEPGVYVTPNSVLYHLEDTSSHRLIMQIPQRYVPDLTLGQEVVIRDVTPTLPPFIITRIFPVTNEWRQRTVEAEPAAPLAQPTLEQQFSVAVVVASAAGVLVPADGFASLGATASGSPSGLVYVAEPRTARRQSITPLLITDSGEAVCDADTLRPDSRLVRLTFQQHLRLPATFPLEVGARP